MDIKDSYFRVELEVWFKWKSHDLQDMTDHFRIYKGLINKKVLLKEKVVGDTHYQLFGIDVSITKDFSSKRFPLESQRLNIIVESTLSCERIQFEADQKDTALNPSAMISGYYIKNTDFGISAYKYNTNQGYSYSYSASQTVNSESCYSLVINRSNLGVYIKCFIALFGTIVWVFIALYICTNHRVDPLGMIPGAFFGAVSNIMVGANILPDALEGGLMEYTNIWGIMTILAVALMIININRIRSHYEDRVFARFYGRILFTVSLVICIIGFVLMPYISYLK